MDQLDLFDCVAKVKKKVGRPFSISSDTVFKIKDDIKRGLKNKKIIQKYEINERTFFRIKKGNYDYLFKEALEKSVDDFELGLSD